MDRWLIAVILAVFSLGFVSASLTTEITKYPLSWDSITKGIAVEVNSPRDHIKSEQIHVYQDKIVIDIENAIWSKFSDTNSMDPLLDIGTNGIEIRPKSINDISIGDVISYESTQVDGVIIHRVVDILEDGNGTYFIVKGDNNPVNDPEKVRFEQVQGILVGVIY